MDEYSELEYKYRADDVHLGEWLDFMETIGFESRLDVSSWDVYYTLGRDQFIRHRQGPKPQLTVKKKTKESNNWNRVEVDLDLDPALGNEPVGRFMELIGFEENFTIYKSCFILRRGLLTYVYYIVYDAQMKERGRFIEIEVDKEAIPDLWDMGSDPEALLEEAEEGLKVLGISSRNRLKKSLFELYRST